MIVRLDYVIGRLDQAIDELSQSRGELRDRLYAAYLKIHTILPEHVPEGRPREILKKIHDGFTKRDAHSPHEESVVSVLHALDVPGASALADNIRGLRDELRAPSTPAALQGAPHGAAPIVTPRRARRTSASTRLRVLILFATNEGHTRVISEFVAARLREGGHEVTLMNVAEADRHLDPANFDVALLSGSLHFGRYQNALIGFATRHHDALNAIRSAFISVSLAAAGAHSGARRELEESLASLSEETQWAPETVHHAAGAIRRRAFDYFRELASVMLMERRGDHVDLTGDYDMTDYPALAEFALGLVRPSAAAGEKLASEP
jgi:menaquinone-dependent protoporphyrinogen oxidase